jgi:quinol monooxygenase YgiN
MEACGIHVESEHFQAVTTTLPKWLADVPEIVHVETPSDGRDRMSELQLEP